jgi:uncharacterized peroxidase-related enzyme
MDRLTAPLVPPLPREDLTELAPVLQAIEARSGYVPNSVLTMARMPGLAPAFLGLAGAVLGGGSLSSELKSLVSFVASSAAGCRYCQAHTSTTASKAGADDARIAAVWEFESSPLFDGRERAALRLARDAAQVPNVVGESHRSELAAWFTPDEITELVSVIALFGFLNRWNDTMGTPLEDVPTVAADRLIGAIGWKPGKHGPPA